MSYQVLARKWRPNRFGELVGQEHVVTAISNALDNNRLHHAYLFTGTRGVGKTTIARIFSKSLNCEQGLSAKPCGQCSTCQEIENGNFIDLLEIDAASRTKVEDTRELLDNVQYKPSRGRYKVYLIDEVHMLSKHSFNALLKTLEEPPPHVKFLLATTDPQKLPVTILSRCLQFNLKALSRTQISQQLDHVLGQENIPFDKESLSQLARAAQGSMRDALSLTDQAIAQGNGTVSLQIVTDMLGLMDKNQVLKLLHAVIQKDSSAAMQQVDFMANQAPDYGLVLAEIMSLLHQIALTQFVPDACKLETISARAIYQLAKTVPAEQVQLLYQIALTGKKDLPHAADARTGLEMTLLRMLAFSPSNIKFEPLDIVEKTPVVDNVLPESSVATSHTHPEPDLAEPSAQIASEVTPLAESPIEPLNQTHQEEPLIVEASQEQNIPAEPESLVVEPQATHSEDDLFLQQQDIMAQAEEYGHQVSDYQQHQPVSLEEHASQQFAENLQTAEPIATSPSTSTSDLIALRNKLKQSQKEQEEGAEHVKKSESFTPPNLVFSGTQKQQPEQNLPTSIDGQPLSEDDVVSQKAAELKDNTPPWETVTTPLEPITSGVELEPKADELRERALSFEGTPQESEVFDSSAHLDHENIGEVTLDVPAFLPNKQKVTKANQLDQWSQLIEDMQITALTKQLALHSAFEQQGNLVTLLLLESKAHLLSDTAQQQLQQALSSTLNSSIELEITLGQPINTPYALQIKVNGVRHEYACEVVRNDPGVQLLQQEFAAKVDEKSIQAR